MEYTEVYLSNSFEHKINGKLNLIQVTDDSKCTGILPDGSCIGETVTIISKLMIGEYNLYIENIVAKFINPGQHISLLWIGDVWCIITCTVEMYEEK